jgi:hypothetical protein
MDQSIARYAKLYETEIGQLLVTLLPNSNGIPEITFYANVPSWGVGRLNAAVADNTESSGIKLKQEFDKITEGHARWAANQIFNITAEKIVNL